MVIGDGIEASVSRTRIRHEIASSDGKLGLAERTLSAAGAAFLSAILMNPLDVAKVYIYIYVNTFVLFLLLLCISLSLFIYLEFVLCSCQFQWSFYYLLYFYGALYAEVKCSNAN